MISLFTRSGHSRCKKNQKTFFLFFQGAEVKTLENESFTSRAFCTFSPPIQEAGPIKATPNASQGSLFNLADSKNHFYHPQRSLMEPAVVLPDLLQNLHYPFFIFVQF